MSEAKTSLSLRPATASDIPTINAIHAHYVTHTVLTFLLFPNSDTTALSKLDSIRSSGLPYIVACDPSSPSHSEPVGYVYATPFRGVKGGYAGTVEISIYCSPTFVGKGAGSALLTQFIGVVRNPSRYGPEWIGPEWGTEDGRVREVIACMAIDETAPKGGWALKEWYERFGFVKRGHLKGVGKKFGRM
jgi:L-amino acid N-acyltransferase YncA